MNKFGKFSIFCAALMFTFSACAAHKSTTVSSINKAQTTKIATVNVVKQQVNINTANVKSL